ncbi:MAG: AgmX/PglI C-terminal domain-containing protein [Deltaproteobacteria bacterium]|nr:AgmX/PglI C-terminal domain-containing protein [Deltaproteobacteria bacterium]
MVRENAGYFRFCFEWELNRHPELTGRLTMAFVIAEDGTVREARVMEDGLENETVTRCFAGVTSRMTFPPPENGEVTVHYPFILDGAPAAERPAGI